MSYWSLDTVSELKIKPLAKKIQNYTNMCIQYVGQWAEID